MLSHFSTMNMYCLLIIIKQSRELGPSLVAQLVKNPPAMQETLVRSLSWEDPWRRKWQPTPVFLPGKFHGRKSLAGYIQSMEWWRVGHELTTSLSLSKNWGYRRVLPVQKIVQDILLWTRVGYIKHHTLVCVVNTQKGGRIKAWLWSSPCGEIISSVQTLSRAQFFVTPGIAALQAFLSITNSKNLLKLKRISQWCHPAISSSVVPFSSCPQSFPASGSFPKSQFFTWVGQSTGVSASASVLPMNTQDWSPLGWTCWLSL